MLDEGNYDNCVLKEAVVSESQNGKLMMMLTFDVGGGTMRSVRLMLNDDTRSEKDGKTNLERSGEQLQRIGFNGDFDDPKFNESVYTDGITLRCKHDEYQGKDKEEWSFGGFSYEKAPETSLQALSRNWRARFGASPRPGKPSGSAPATRTPPSRKPPAKKDEPSDDMTDTSSVTDMDSAFKFVMKHNSGLSDDEWASKIAAHEKRCRRKEAAFTADDWKAVATDCVVPFG